MDEAIQFAIEKSEANWNNIKNDLKDLIPEEIDWRPLPYANNSNVLVKYLRVVEEVFVSRLDQGEQSPYSDGPSVQKLTESVPQNSTGICSSSRNFTTALSRPCAQRPWRNSSEKPF